MPNDIPLPTLGELISNWLGFQLPTIPMPQAVKNFDKAVGKILLAAGENFEARLKANTAKKKVQGKIDVEGLYRTEEEKRKIENRANTLAAAAEELSKPQDQPDATSEIEDDWLNLFARLAEDKSSEELQLLFGRILAGEVRKPGSYSLRTLQFVATLSKAEAQSVSIFLSYVLNGGFVPTYPDGSKPGPSVHMRILMEELGVASTPSSLGGMAWNFEVAPQERVLMAGTGLGIVVQNASAVALKFQHTCQILSQIGKELLSIANPGQTDLNYMKDFACSCLNSIHQKYATQVKNGEIKVFVAAVQPAGSQAYSITVMYQAEMPPTG